jgi:hypothetical protein
MFATWLYVSTSLLEENADAEIASIRSTAELRNSELGLTGVLIFSGLHFAQFLEGPASSIEVMKTCICGDDRHAGVLTLQSNPIKKRRYGHWALAYSGWASGIDGVLSRAARDHDVRELVNYMDAFVAKLH